MNQQPRVVIIAGPNGAGKSTAAPAILRDVLGVDEFVNADTIAKGLSAYAPDTVAIEAGRIMLRRIAELSKRRSDFAFETTLATRSFAPKLRHLRESGYKIYLVFLALPNPDFAILRVKNRVQHGGHDVPNEVIARRFQRGLSNLFQLYMPLVDHWRVYDNASEVPSLIAQQELGSDIMIADQEQWLTLQSLGSNA